MIGETLGRYKILRQVGSGGMGEVYAAQDPELNRQIAIKVLSGEMASDPERVARFEREAKAVAALDHPNIVTIHSVEEAGGKRFITMQLVEGETLDERIPKKGLSLQRFFDLAIPMADALSVAHEHGITHRDLKPTNVMVSEDGRVKILDFGLAKLREVSPADGPTLDPDKPLTEEGKVVGTVAYMSPEQAEGKPVDHRSDIFSLGILLYEMATGERPFKGDTRVSLISSIVKDTPQSVNELRAALPRHLDRIIRLALAKDREHRLQSVKDLRNELEDLRREVSSDELLRGATTPRPPSVPLVAGLVLGAVAVVAFAFLFGFGTSVQPRFEVGQRARMTYDAGLEIHPTLSHDGQWVAYVAGPPGRRKLYARLVAPGALPFVLAEDLGGNHLWPQWHPQKEHEIVFEASGQRRVLPPSPGSEAQLLEGVDGERGMTWSPRGRKIAYVQGTSLMSRDIENRESTVLVEEAEMLEPSAPSWSPDDTWIAFVSGNPEYAFAPYVVGNIAGSSILLVPSEGGDPVPVVPQDSRLNANPVWFDAETLLYLSDKDGLRDVYAVTIGSDGSVRGEPERVTTGLDAHSFGLSGDGTRLVYSEFSSRANIWSVPIPDAGDDSAARVESEQVTWGNQVVEGIGVARDGKLLAYDSNVWGNQDIYKMELPDGKPTRLTDDPAADFLPALSHDGREIAFYSYRESGNRDLWSMNVDGTNEKRITSGPAQDRYPHWAADGSMLVFYSDRSGQEDVWSVSRGDRGWGEPSPVRTAGGGVYPRLSPNGEEIVFGRGTEVFVIPAAGGEPRKIIDRSLGLKRTPFSIWSQDGETIYVKGPDESGISKIWSVPRVGGGVPRILVTFDDPSKPSIRTEFAHDGERFYFTMSEQESDVFTLELLKR